MRILARWNPSLKKYTPYSVPDDRKITLLETDMDKVVECARCGRKVVYGDTYTSMQLHTKAGMGYAVCAKCYGAEIAEERRAIEEK